jgi:transcriptional regulator with XRE-family HTH domain
VKTTAERFAAIRAALGLSGIEMSAAAGVNRDTWRRYEAGDLPNGETLSRLAQLGFSVDWILTGNGPMRLGLAEEQAARGIERPSSPVSADLLMQIFEALTRLYSEEKQRLPVPDHARLTAELYNDLELIADEAERRGALRYAVETMRKELRAAAAGDPSSKRRA